MKKKSAKIKKNQQYLPSASSQNDVSLSNITKNLTAQQGNHYELFGEDYKQGDVEGCVQDLLSVLREYSADGFRQVMFRQFIKNPMGMSYSKQDYVKTMSILRAAIAQTESENYPKSKTKLLYELEFYTYVFYENNKINTKMLEANAYFMRSLSQQMRMICTHIQDYALRMEAVIFEQQNRRPIAWADPLATTMPVNDIKKAYISPQDSYEEMLDRYDKLFSYIFYKSRNNKTGGTTDGFYDIKSMD